MNPTAAVYAAAFVGGQLAGVAIGSKIAKKLLHRETPSDRSYWLQMSYKELMPKETLYLY